MTLNDRVVQIQRMRDVIPNYIEEQYPGELQVIETARNFAEYNVQPSTLPCLHIVLFRTSEIGLVTYFKILTSN